ncbi:MAG: Mutator MutT protein (7,8-dihydro-8-oxoguanine-triphosphatase), partial [uncultured Lysobacter sp.]
AVHADRRDLGLCVVARQHASAARASQCARRRRAPGQVQRPGRKARSRRGRRGRHAPRDPRGGRDRMHRPVAARHDQLAGLRQAGRGLARLHLPHHLLPRHATGCECGRHAGVGRAGAVARAADVGRRPAVPAAGVRPRPARVPRSYALPRRAHGVLAVFTRV